MNAKVGNLARRRPEFESAIAVPKQLNLKSLAMQADLKNLSKGFFKNFGKSILLFHWFLTLTGYSDELKLTGVASLFATEIPDFEKLIHKNTYDYKNILSYVKDYHLENFQIYHCRFGSFYIEKDYPEKSYDVKRSIVIGHGWDHQAVSLMSQYVVPGTIAIDIGAHIGSLTNMLCDFVGSNGKVIAFEAMPCFFSELCWNMALNKRANVELYWAGISSENAYHTLDEMGWSHWAKGFSGLIQFITLDSLQLNNVSFIKIDIEWMEDKFILGAKETLSRCRPVLLIELMGGHSYEEATGAIREAIFYRIKLLEDLGYTVKPLGGHDYLALPKKLS